MISLLEGDRWLITDSTVWVVFKGSFGPSVTCGESQAEWLFWCGHLLLLPPYNSSPFIVLSKWPFPSIILPPSVELQVLQGN